MSWSQVLSALRSYTVLKSKPYHLYGRYFPCRFESFRIPVSTIYNFVWLVNYKNTSSMFALVKISSSSIRASKQSIFYRPPPSCFRMHYTVYVRSFPPIDSSIAVLLASTYPSLLVRWLSTPPTRHYPVDHNFVCTQ